MSRMRLCPFWSVTLLTIVVFATAGCSADNSGPRNNEAIAGREGTASDPLEDLLRRTRSNGSVRVIAQLRIPPGVEATHEQRIKATQQALLAELARVPHQVLRTYSVTPALALDASHQALQVLRDSPYVSRVEEDALAKPFSKPGEGTKAK